MEKRRKERIDRGIMVRSDSLYALMSWREMAYLSFPRLLLIIGMLSLPFAPNNWNWQGIITLVCVYAMLAISFDFLAHYIGLVSLGGAFFVGVGGYIAGLLNITYCIEPLYTIPIASIGGGALCTLLLLPCLALRGVYFAIVTLMYPLLFVRLIEALDIFGGTDGLLGIEGFSNPWVEQYIVIITVLLFLFGMRRMVNMDLGLVLRGVKDNDQAVRASGINIFYYKGLAIFIASALGCLSGACIVYILESGGISLFALEYSIFPIAATVIGGSGTLIGPVLGCFILIPISEWLREFGTLRTVFYSLILVGFIVFKSEGIMAWAERKYHQFERWTKI